MDCVIVLNPKVDLVVTEPRRVKKGQLVAVGTAEDGSQGILVHSEGFLGAGHSANEFGFMQTAVSRERPVDYAVLAQLLGEEKQRGGKILWAEGPAPVDAPADLQSTRLKSSHSQISYAVFCLNKKRNNIYPSSNTE